MGRTLHYKLQADKPIPWDIWREIRAVQALMNFRFTWTCEELSLSLIGSREREVYGFTTENPPVQAWGFTKVRDDEWDTLLVTKFVTWLSRRLPDAIIKLYDEGDFIPVGNLVFRGGTPKPDHEALEKNRAYWKKHGLREPLRRLEEALIRAEDGIFYADVPALDYLDRAEISQEIALHEFTETTLDEVAARIAFPWDTEQLQGR